MLDSTLLHSAAANRLGVLAFSICFATTIGCESGEPEPLTRAQLLDPETCKDCHSRHYREWASSMHAYATTDPVFQAMNRRGQEEAQLGDFCVKCHAPMAVRENAIADFADLTTLPKHLQGVTCYFCHNAVGVGTPHNNANIQLANDTTMRAALRNPVKPYAHDVGYSVHHDPSRMESSLLCGTCHDIVTPRGYHLERTLQEYLSSTIARPAGFLSCQDCHMKANDQLAPVAEYPRVPARAMHSHLWPAVDVALTPDWPGQPAMRSAVERCELQQRSLTDLKVEQGTSLAGEPFTFTVYLETAAAHSMPSGAISDRRMWLEVVAYDANGIELLRTDEIADGELEIKPDATNFCVFRDRILDAAGNETHMFWEAASRDERLSNSLPPQINPTVRHFGQCDFTTPRPTLEPAARILIHVRMRPMGVDVLQDLVNSGHLDPKYVLQMPTFTVTRREATYDRAKQDYKVKDLSNDDCDEYLEMLE